MTSTFLNHSVESQEDFEALIGAFLHQNGYDSENSKRGLRSASLDYKAVFNEELPAWIKTIWQSTALSLVHLAIEVKEPLPNQITLPAEAIRS